MSKNTYVNTGRTFGKIGTILALLLSWITNHSICWMLLHMVFGWFYVIYWLIQYAGAEQIVKETLIG